MKNIYLNPGGERFLKSFIPVAMKIKAASLFTFRKEAFRPLILKDKLKIIHPLAFIVLKDSGQRIHLLLYNREMLEKILMNRTSRKFLSKFGYSPGYQGMDEDLKILTERYSESKTLFPHEIGIFLGYPLKDVAGFIYNPGRCVFHRGALWKIFGRPEASMELMEKIKEARKSAVFQAENLITMSQAV